MAATKPDPKTGYVFIQCEIVEDVFAELEDFIFLSRLGLFTEARQLFEQNLEQHQNFFPVVAEFAGMLLEDGQHEELSEFLRTQLEKKFSGYDCQLLSVMLALSEAYLERSRSVKDIKPGTSSSMLQKAQEQASCFRYRLIEHSDDLSDVELQILETCLMIQVLAASTSHQAVPVNQNSPSLGLDIPWENFIQLCLRLNQEEKFLEAQRIFTILVPALRAPEAESFFQGYMRSLKSSKSFTERATATVTAELAATNSFISCMCQNRKYIKRHGMIHVSEAFGLLLRAKGLWEELLEELNGMGLIRMELSKKGRNKKTSTEFREEGNKTPSARFSEQGHHFEMWKANHEMLTQLGSVNVIEQGIQTLFYDLVDSLDGIQIMEGMVDGAKLFWQLKFLKLRLCRWFDAAITARENGPANATGESSRYRRTLATISERFQKLYQVEKQSPEPKSSTFSFELEPDLAEQSQLATQLEECSHNHLGLTHSHPTAKSRWIAVVPAEFQKHISTIVRCAGRLEDEQNVQLWLERMYPEDLAQLESKVMSNRSIQTNPAWGLRIQQVQQIAQDVDPCFSRHFRATNLYVLPTLTEKTDNADDGLGYAGFIEEQANQGETIESTLRNAIRGGKNSTLFTKLLLSRYGDGVATQEAVKIIARSFDKRSMELLLDQWGSLVDVDEDVTEAAESNEWDANGMIELLRKKGHFTMLDDLERPAQYNKRGGEKVTGLRKRKRDSKEATGLRKRKRNSEQVKPVQYNKRGGEKVTGPRKRKGDSEEATSDSEEVTGLRKRKGNSEEVTSGLRSRLQNESNLGSSYVEPEPGARRCSIM